MLANHINEIGFCLISAVETHTSEGIEYGICMAFNKHPDTCCRYVTWEYKIESGFASVFWGHYFTKSETAILDYQKRLIEARLSQIDWRYSNENRF